MERGWWRGGGAVVERGLMAVVDVGPGNFVGLT